MSEITSKILAEAVQRYGPVPEQFMFGDGIDWSSPLEETMLYVELSFWLMIPPGGSRDRMERCSFHGPRVRTVDGGV